MNAPNYRFPCLTAVAASLLVSVMPWKSHAAEQQPETSPVAESGPHSPLARPLRVLTANIWNYSGPYKKRSKLLRARIGALDPDLIGFQEAGWTPGEDHQVKKLLSGMNYHFVHEAEGTAGSKRRLYDLAIASRWPIKRKGLWKVGDKGLALAVEVDAPAPMGRFLFVSTVGNGRFQFDRELERERGAVDLDKNVRGAADPAGFPPIIAGDFDATPDSASMRFLTGKQSLQGRSTHYYDAWQVAPGKGPGWTWSTRNDYARATTARTWNLTNHHRRIDYILLGSPHHYRDYARVTSCRVALDEPSGSDWPSDHFGVFAEIAVRPETAPSARGSEP